MSDFYLPGDFIGLDAETNYLFTAEAVTNTTLRAVLAAQRRRARLGGAARRAQAAVGMACHGLSAAQQRFVLLARKTADERIASFPSRSRHAQRRDGRRVAADEPHRYRRPSRTHHGDGEPRPQPSEEPRNDRAREQSRGPVSRPHRLGRHRRVGVKRRPRRRKET